MATVIEVGAPLVETALTFAPWLVDVPVLGRILLAISPGGGNEFAAQEALQAQLRRLETDRRTRIDRNARYVIKASDAMQCVETHVMNGGLLLAIGRGIINTVAGKVGGTIPDVLCDRVFTCIESKVLKQTGRRVKKTKKWYGRPARGHGRGRA